MIDVYKDNHLSDKNEFHNQLVIIVQYGLTHLLLVILIQSNLDVEMRKEVLVIKMVQVELIHHHPLHHDKNRNLEYHYHNL